MDERRLRSEKRRVFPTIHIVSAYNTDDSCILASALVTPLILTLILLSAPLSDTVQIRSLMYTLATQTN